jgi:hypothetical protein
MLVVILAILVVAVAAFFIGKFSDFSISNTIVETNETQTITYLEKNKEIALVTLGVTDIFDETHSKEIFGNEIPWSKKQTFIKATFEVKLGIDGNNVTINEIGEMEYEINVPEFIFIGYNNPVFEHVTDNNGVLSFVTEDVDQTEMINKIFDDEGKQKYIDQYKELLKESTQEFYQNLLPSSYSDVKLTFNFQ